MKTARTIILSSFILLLAGVLIPQEKKPVNTWDGSFSVPAHRIPLKDQFNQTIIPTESFPLPYSTRYTCAPCHDYGVIEEGLHFNAGSDADAGRVGEPWIWVDTVTGTVIPLSYRNWKGMFHPREVGLSPWEFTLLFGRHMTGGGVSEPDWEKISSSSRWEVAGMLEINCLACHNASRNQSHSEWAKQVLRENFRWAGVAASGIGEVKGMASRLPPTWTIIDGPNPDDTEYAVVPSVKYSPNDFDDKHNIFFDLLRQPDDGRCLTCHSVSPVNIRRHSYELDVHSASGLKCTDCHVNGIDHNMTRGYEAEADELGEPDRFDFTCQGCHIGSEFSGDTGKNTGRMGAPYPTHNGIPAIHFEKLNCTVCHSGPLPAKEPIKVRTSRGNRLGIYGIAQWDMDFPQIVEPVYARDKSNKVAPHRLIWPSYWAKVENGESKPLNPAEVIEAGKTILDAEAEAARILTALLASPNLPGEPVLIVTKNAYRVNLDAGLDVFSYEGPDSDETMWWGLKTEQGIIPLIAQFDPDSEEQAVESEVLIENILFVLKKMENAAGEPEMHFRGYIYSIQEGYLDKKKKPDKNAPPNPEFFWKSGDDLIPLLSGFHLRTILATVGKEESLTEEQVALILKNLIALKENGPNKGETTEYVYLCSGRRFFLENDELVSKKDKAADPVLWPLAHQVRPAQQSLGMNGCEDCHSANSSFFFSTIRGSGPLVTDQVEEKSGVDFMGLDDPYQRLFGFSFTARDLLKLLLFISVFVIGIILFIAIGLKLGEAAGLIRKRR
ncbi:MAG: hypothetical protein JW755_11685 [Candidatus Aminicenantes bacterium]|nr:hypothetical protein [Candidatus Aminicenantes bacterium]